MPNRVLQTVEVEFTAEFKRNIRQLSKKYRHIKSDVQPVINELESGETPGNRIQRLKYIVFKVRIRNTDIQKGKSSGYRMIYYLKRKTKVILVTIYSKTEQGDISPERIRRIITDLEESQMYRG